MLPGGNTRSLRNQWGRANVYNDRREAAGLHRKDPTYMFNSFKHGPLKFVLVSHTDAGFNAGYSTRVSLEYRLSGVRYKDYTASYSNRPEAEAFMARLIDMVNAAIRQENDRLTAAAQQVPATISATTAQLEDAGEAPSSLPVGSDNLK